MCDRENEPTRALAEALEQAIREAARDAPDPIAFLDTLAPEFARTLTSEHLPAGDDIAQLRLRATLAAAFAAALAKVRRDFAPE